MASSTAKNAEQAPGTDDSKRVSMPGGQPTRRLSEFKRTPETLPDLNAGERREAVRRASISALIVHEAVREEGERELTRHPVALAWSGLAAGLSMGFSLVAHGLLRAYLPAVAWRPLVASLGYTLGFLIVVLGRQQLFTENTLTAILPLLAHPTQRRWLLVARLWAVVLVANLFGAFLVATVAAHTAVFTPEVKRAFAEIGMNAIRGDFWLTLLRAIFAGWLIALMVWLLPAAEATRLHVVLILTYIVSLGAFAHVIAGSVDVMDVASSGAITWLDYLGRFLLPTLIGNIIGG